jgi:hypothetical protein
MIRFPNWPARLEGFFLLHETTPPKFCYGTFDCCIFACDAIEAMTGVDPAAGFRGKYSCLKEARFLMRDYCGSSSVRALAEKITTELGMPEEANALRLQRGDLALIRRPRDYLLGIVSLTGQDIVVATAKGIERISLFTAMKGWHA